MAWDDKIKAGMRLIKDGCEEAEAEHGDCEACPFWDICPNDFCAPTVWEIEED